MYFTRQYFLHQFCDGRLQEKKTDMQVSKCFILSGLLAAGETPNVHLSVSLCVGLNFSFFHYFLGVRFGTPDETLTLVFDILLYIISLLTGDMNSINQPRSHCVACYLSW